MVTKQTSSNLTPAGFYASQLTHSPRKTLQQRSTIEEGKQLRRIKVSPVVLQPFYSQLRRHSRLGASAPGSGTSKMLIGAAGS
ncbi:hypothetical protein CHARACLAT_033510 [Characodon lateralis]|uniref:Uncharacterized protein n=1 Tax=Characodon lateralis TaxID=208331 RepID=A0ABU7EQ57_9TELE|nr:hypothetical protein [Characodon lateralis]